MQHLLWIERLRTESRELAEAALSRHGGSTATVATPSDKAETRQSLEDAELHVRYLIEAVEAESEVLFVDHVRWTNVMSCSRSARPGDLGRQLECLRDVLRDRCREDEFRRLDGPLTAGLKALSHRVDEGASSLTHHAIEPLASNYLSALLGGDRRQAVQMIHDAVADGTSIRDLYLRVFQPAQYELGRLWQLNRISVAQEHYCTAVTQLVMSQLYPHILSGPRTGRVMVCACIGGDLHEIGSRMVADLFELEGWNTFYLGANTPVAGIVQQVADQGADLLAISVTMTYHIPELRQTVAAVRDASPALIIVGGRPFIIEPELWRSVGADGCAANAADALVVAERLIEGGS